MVAFASWSKVDAYRHRPVGIRSCANRRHGPLKLDIVCFRTVHDIPVLFVLMQHSPGAVVTHIAPGGDRTTRQHQPSFSSATDCTSTTSCSPVRPSLPPEGPSTDSSTLLAVSIADSGIPITNTHQRSFPRHHSPRPERTTYPPTSPPSTHATCD